MPTASTSSSPLASLLARGVREVWRDEDIWVLDKPPGVLSHPNPPAKRAASALLLADYDFDRELYRVRDPAGEKGTRQIWLAHRLDRDTSGLILCAFTAEAAMNIKESLERREVSKEYRALVLGNPADLAGEWRDHLERSRRDGRVEVAVVRGSPPNATTGYQVITRLPTAGLSVLALTPREGRTHQIRVQCAKHGHPIAGDDRYGDFTANRRLAAEARLERMFLVAYRLKFRHPRTGKAMSFEAELRPELAAVIEKLESAKTKVPRRAVQRRSKSSR